MDPIMDTEPEPEPGTSSSFLPSVEGSSPPIPEQVSSEDEEETLSVYPEDCKFLRFFKKTVKELIRWLDSSTFHPGFPVSSLYEILVDRLMEQMEMQAWVKITFKASDAQLFPDEVDAISYIVEEVYEDLLNRPWRMKISDINEGIVCYITYGVMNAFIEYTRSCCKEDSSSSDTDETEEGSQGEPELQEDCSTIQHHPPSEDSEVEINEDLEVPVHTNGTTVSTTGTKKWKNFRTRISSFMRRVFCFGCLPSRRGHHTEMAD
ncbi:hypothetical protein AOLI_G00255410 [Acnodon oligacanthus]